MENKVFAPNTKVVIDPGNDQRSIEGLITCVNLLITGVSYDISYWKGQEYVTVTLREGEFAIRGSQQKKETVGYK